MGLYYEVDNHHEFNYFLEPSQHCVAVTVYHVVMYDSVTRMVQFVTLGLKQGAVRLWRCLRDIFVQLNVSLI